MVAGPGFEPGTFGFSGCAYFRGWVRSITIGVNVDSVRIHWSGRRLSLVRCVSLDTAGLREKGVIKGLRVYENTALIVAACCCCFRLRTCPYISSVIPK